MHGVYHREPAQTEAQNGSAQWVLLLFLESRRTTTPRVEARFPRNLAQKNRITRISNVWESLEQREGRWKDLGLQKKLAHQNWLFVFAWSFTSTTPRVEACFTPKLAQNNDIIRTVNVCKSQQVVLWKGLVKGRICTEIRTSMFQE